MQGLEGSCSKNMLEPMSLARAGRVVRVADIRAMILQYLFCLAAPGSADGCGSSGAFHGGRQVVMIMCNDVDGDCDDGDDDDDDLGGGFGVLKFFLHFCGCSWLQQLMHTMSPYDIVISSRLDVPWDSVYSGLP